LISFIKTSIKQLYCKHSIEIITESSLEEHVFIAKSIIKCKKCEKTFTQNQIGDCCYVKHIHSQMLYEHFIAKIKKGQQS
jgi:hypothetical protein